MTEAAGSPRRTRQPRVRRVPGAREQLPARGPHRRRHEATRREVAANGLPGPAGTESALVDAVLDRLAAPEAEWVFDLASGTWRPARDDDDPWARDTAAESTDAPRCGSVEAPEEGSDEAGPLDLLDALAAAEAGYERWLEERADPTELARVVAVTTERAEMAAARRHVAALRAAQAGVGRAQAQQIRVLAEMAPLYRTPARHLNDDTDDERVTGGVERLAREVSEAGLDALVAEVAPALGWTDASAAALVRLALQVTATLPHALARLEAGRLQLELVRVLAGRTRELDAQLAREVDAEVFGADGTGVGLSSRRLAEVVDAAVAVRDTDAVFRRSRRRTSARSVAFAVVGDGISRMTVTGPTTALAAAYEHVRAVATANLAEARTAAAEGRVAADGGDPYAIPGVDVADAADLGDVDALLADRRGLGAHCFDALVTAVLLGRPAAPGSARPTPGLEVHTSISTAVGASDDPGWLEGYGWLPGWLVRQGLTWAGCRLRRVLTDPFTGDLVTVDGHTYPASWLTDPDPDPGPPGPPRGPRRGPTGPVRPGSGTGPGADADPPPSPAAPQTFRGQPLQHLPPPATADDAFGPATVVDGPADAAGPANDIADTDDEWQVDVADTADACTAGTCHPVDLEQCPVARAGGGPHRPGRLQDRHVRRRHRRCVHPGCTRRATSCDVDHVVPHGHAEGGPTCGCNLEPRCRRHHLLKHATDPGTWRNPESPDDVPWSARWTQWRCDRGSSHTRSPLGIEHHTRPDAAAPPAEPFRPTPWPPRHPVDAEVKRLERQEQLAGALAHPSDRTDSAERPDPFAGPPTF